MRAELLYDWERNYVEPHAQYYLSKDSCIALIEKASLLAGIRRPDIRFMKSASAPCRAVPGKWQIVITDWGRTPVTVLHEVAHLAAFPAQLKGEDPHGPAFLAQAISFYANFLGLDEEKMRQTAASVGLKAGQPPQGMRRREPRASTSSFGDVEF